MLTSRLCEEKESRKEKARQEHAVKRVVVGREREGGNRPDCTTYSFLRNNCNGPSAIVHANKGQFASKKGKSRSGEQVKRSHVIA